METTHKIETVFEKQKRLLSVVESVYNLDLKSKCRETKYVSARISYSYILRGLGLGWTFIGSTLNKTHSTIINNINKFDTYMRFEPTFKAFHKTILDKFERGSVDYFDIKQLDTESEIKTLKLKIKELDLHNSTLTYKIENIEDFNKSNESIHRLINQRVTPDKEKEVELKLNRILNGL
tara:strand:+ start:415 stop:951 length:537 start_codon:yes stop_codon:yes gene_type:complete